MLKVINFLNYEFATGYIKNEYRKSKPKSFHMANRNTVKKKTV